MADLFLHDSASDFDPDAEAIIAKGLFGIGDSKLIWDLLMTGMVWRKRYRSLPESIDLYFTFMPSVVGCSSAAMAAN